MCELLAMSSRHATRLTFSLEALSSHSAAPGVSRDGWGVAYYQDHDVALFREPSAASARVKTEDMVKNLMLVKNQTGKGTR